MTAQTLLKQIDRLPVSVLITDEASTILYANRPTTDQSGFDLPQVIGSRPKDLWGGAMDRSFYQRMWQNIREHQRPFVGTVFNQTKTQEYYKPLLCILPITDAGSQYFFAFSKLGSTTDQEQFRSFFTSHFDAPISPAQFAEFCTSVFQIDIPTGSASFFEFLQTAFIEPVAEQYSERIADKELVLQAQHRPEAFRLLYKKYYSMVQMYFLKRVSDLTKSEHLAQETFLKAFQALPTFRQVNASYQTYLLRIAHNLLVDFYRKQRTQDSLPALPVTPSHAPVDAELLLKFAKELLTDTEYRCLTGFYLSGFSVKEIAKQEDKSSNAVKLHLSRARKKLRKSFRNREH